MRKLRPKGFIPQAQTPSGLRAVFCLQNIQCFLNSGSDWGYIVILSNTIYHIQLTNKWLRNKNLNASRKLYWLYMFFNLSTINTWGQTILCCERLSCTLWNVQQYTNLYALDASSTPILGTTTQCLQTSPTTGLMLGRKSLLRAF